MMAEKKGEKSRMMANINLKSFKRPSTNCLDNMRRDASFCQGFTKSHSGLSPNRLRLQGLKEYSDNYPILDYLGPVLGSKCLVMQTKGNYLRQSGTWTFGGDLREEIS
jgi:hypothetical protein